MADPPPQIGVLLGSRGALLRASREHRSVDAAPLLEMAQAAEAASLDSVWVGDSLLAKPRLEPVALLAAVAARTSRVRIGTAVLLPALRHPLTLAHSLATVDIVSKGRLIVGAGVGGAFTPEQRQEWTAAGVSPERRAGRLTEVVQVMRLLWQQDHVTFHGRHVHLDNVTLEPKPVQQGGIPILLATHFRARSEAQFRRAARYSQGVIGITDSPAEFAQVLQRVEALARQEGRDPSVLQRAFYLTVHIGEDRAAAGLEAEDFLRSYYGVNHWGGRWGPWGPPEAVAARMAEYAQAGARHLIVRFAAWDQPGQLRRFVEQVIPAFHAVPAASRRG